MQDGRSRLDGIAHLEAEALARQQCRVLVEHARDVVGWFVQCKLGLREYGVAVRVEGVLIVTHVIDRFLGSAAACCEIAQRELGHRDLGQQSRLPR